MILEKINIRIHSVCRRRSHTSASHAGWSLCRTCIVDRMVFHILRKVLTFVKTLFELGVSDITSDDDSTVKTQTCSDRIFRKYLADFTHRLVKVYLYSITLSCFAQLLRNK